MSLDLNKLESKLDKALRNETSETLTKFLNDKRMTNSKQKTAVGLIYEAFTKSGRSGFTEWLWENKNSLEEIERNTIAKAFDDGDYNYYCSIQTGNDLDDGQEHYQEFNDGQDYYEKKYGGNK